MYENAKNGIGKIFTSQILTILAAICALVAAIFAVVAANAVSESLTGGAYRGSIGLAIFTLAYFLHRLAERYKLARNCNYKTKTFDKSKRLKIDRASHI